MSGRTLGKVCVASKRNGDKCTRSSSCKRGTKYYCWQHDTGATTPVPKSGPKPVKRKRDEEYLKFLEEYSQQDEPLEERAGRNTVEPERFQNVRMAKMK